MTPARRPPKRSALSTPMLGASDFTAYLREKADEIAPADVDTLLGMAERARERAAGDKHVLLRRQLDLALDLLDDHATGRSPQIPYHCVSLLSVAVLYFLDPNDVIPDWIPDVGTSDDALVFELAFELGAPGIDRYCAWKGIPTVGLLPQRQAGGGASKKVERRKQGSRKATGGKVARKPARAAKKR